MILQIPPDCTTRFLKSANTPHLKSGAEPRILYAAGALSFLCVLWTQNRYGLVLAIVIFLFGRAIARRMAREDPYLSVVLGHALHFKRSYPRVPLQGILFRSRK